MGESFTSLSLLERARHQEPEAWNRLHYLYAPMVQYWCQHEGVNGASAEDIAQEVFQAVAQNLVTFRRDRPGDTFRGWLRMITHRKILDMRRREKAQPHAEGGADAYRVLQQVPDPGTAETQDTPEQLIRLHHRALELVRSQFEHKTWQAFWRTAVEGQAPADVAADLQMTSAAVRQSKSRVLRRLKEECGDLLG